MDPLDRLEDLAFGFVDVLPRAAKPRQTGLTSIADRGMTRSQVAGLLENAARFIDLAKISAGMFRLQSEQVLRDKIDLYHREGIRVFLAGDVCEAAFLQGKSSRFLAHARDLGVDAMEVSSAQVAMSLRDKCRLIEMCREAGLSPVAEIGQKANEAWTGSERHVSSQIRHYLDAGAWKILFQDEGVSRHVPTMRTDLMSNIVADFAVDDFLFQVKLAEAQHWLIATYGHEVNLDVDAHQVLEVELMRRGLRGRGLFGLIGGLRE